MAKVFDLFQSRFLRAEDLGRHRVRVTIEQVRVETMHGTKKPVLYFQGKSKALVVNQTRARSLANVLGSDETDEWIGCTVTIYADGAEVTDDRGRKRRVQVICVDERPESALRPRRAGEATTPSSAAPARPIEAGDIKW